MPHVDVLTMEYDLPLKKLLERRLKEQETDFVLSPCENGVRIRFRSREENAVFEALTRILCRDIQYFVLAKMTDVLPLSLSEKQEVLTDALCAARAGEERAFVTERVKAHLREETVLCLEGFLQFRLQAVVMLWELCVEEAAASVLMRKEYSELMRVLHSYVQGRPARIQKLRLCIRTDGSCLISDESGISVEYVDCSPDGLVSLLVSMAPNQLIIYDQSDGVFSSLPETLRRIFSGRVQVYHADH